MLFQTSDCGELTRSHHQLLVYTLLPSRHSGANHAAQQSSHTAQEALTLPSSVSHSSFAEEYWKPIDKCFGFILFKLTAVISQFSSSSLTRIKTAQLLWKRLLRLKCGAVNRQSYIYEQTVVALLSLCYLLSVTVLSKK